MIMIRAMAVTISVATTPAATQAQGNSDHLVTLNTRTFDLGTDVSKMRRDPDFVPMNEIDWLSPTLDADPVLGPTVFHIKVAHPSLETVSYLWQWEVSSGQPPGYGQSYDFKFSENIPEHFQIPGYEARSYHEDGLGPILLISDGLNADYSVKCDQDRKTGEVVYCLILASYPPDPLIYLQARHYSPENWDKTREELDDIVARMREIAYCLDVTDREIEFDAAGQRKIAGCKVGAGM